MNYILNIKEIIDGNKKSYYVFDSFGTFLGIFTNILLAYDLIIACCEDLENTYKVGELSNFKKQIDEALNKKNDLKLTDCENIKLIDEMIHSMKKISGEVDEYEGTLIFHTTPITLDGEFLPVFDKDNINKVYWTLLKKANNNKFNSDERALAHLKKKSLETLTESEFLRFFSPLPDALNNSEERKDKMKKEI